MSQSQVGTINAKFDRIKCRFGIRDYFVSDTYLLIVAFLIAITENFYTMDSQSSQRNIT